MFHPCHRRVSLQFRIYYIIALKCLVTHGCLASEWTRPWLPLHLHWDSLPVSSLTRCLALSSHQERLQTDIRAFLPLALLNLNCFVLLLYLTYFLSLYRFSFDISGLILSFQRASMHFYLYFCLTCFHLIHLPLLVRHPGPCFHQERCLPFSLYVPSPFLLKNLYR